jgi:hypothetical protein
MSDVGRMTEAADRNSANIRIYCDEEKRWKARIDPKTQQNSGGWEDADNWIQYQGRAWVSRAGCLDTKGGGNKYTYAQMYQTYIAGDPPEKQAEPRATITVCSSTTLADTRGSFQTLTY